MFDYKRLVQARSMLNTPPTFALFVMKQMLDWIESHGGLKSMAARNAQKAQIIRDAIDATNGFFKHVGDENSILFTKSRTRCTFRRASRIQSNDRPARPPRNGRLARFHLQRVPHRRLPHARPIHHRFRTKKRIKVHRRHYASTLYESGNTPLPLIDMPKCAYARGVAMRPRGVR